MKVCLLLLSVLTLLQLHNGFAAENIWLPNLQKLSSIIHICEHKLGLERNHQLPVGLRIKNKKPENVRKPENVKKPENVNINSRISVNSDKSNGPSVKSNVDVKVNKNAVSVSHSVNVGKNRDPFLLIQDQPVEGIQMRKGFHIKLPRPPKLPKLPKSPVKPTIEIPLDRIFSGNDQASGMARSPLAPPLSNVVTVNNLNKQDDALRSLGLRSQPADDISPRHLVAKLPFRRIFRQKERYKNIAQCVKLRLVKAYEEEMAFYD